MLKQSVILRQKLKYHRNIHEILNMETGYLEILKVWRLDLLDLFLKSPLGE